MFVLLVLGGGRHRCCVSSFCGAIHSFAHVADHFVSYGFVAEGWAVLVASALSTNLGHATMLRFAHRLAAFMAIVLYCVIWYQATIKVGAGSGQPTEVPRPRRSSIWISRGQQDVQAPQEVGQEGLPHPQRAQRRQRQEQHASPTAPCVLYAGVLFRAGVCSVFHHMRTADALDGCVSICRRQGKHGAVVCSVMLSMIAFDSLCGVRTTWLRSQQTAT